MKITEVELTTFEQILGESITWEHVGTIFENVDDADVKVSQCFVKTNKKHVKNGRVQQALKDFIVHKTESPNTPYGGKDYPMTGKGPLGGIKHAGLTNDVSVMYEVKNGTVYLFAIGSHDDLGFGRPNNIKKQKSLIKKINNFCKSENI